MQTLWGVPASQCGRNALAWESDESCSYTVPSNQQYAAYS